MTIERIIYGMCSIMGISLGISIMSKSEHEIARGIGMAIIILSLVLLHIISRENNKDD